MKFAIEPRGVGKPVGFRSVSPDEQALAPHEAFFHQANSVNEIAALVLGDDGLSLRVKTSDELADVVREQRLVDLKDLRDAIQYDAFEYRGAWYDCSAESQTKIIGKVVAEVVRHDTAAVHDDTMVPDAWRDANNVWQPTEIIDGHKTLKKLAGAMDEHIQSCYTAFAVHEAGILVDPDPASYDMSAGWPNTRIDID